MFICSVPVIPSMPIGRFLRHGHIFHPVRVLVCHSCAIICNSLVFWLLHSSTLSYNVKKLYIPVNLLYSGDGAEFIVEGHIYGFSPVTITNSCHAPGWGRRIPPVLPTAWVPSFREPMPAPSSVPALACICFFSLSDRRNGTLYRENVLSGTRGLWKHVLYEENVLCGTKGCVAWMI